MNGRGEVSHIGMLMGLPAVVAASLFLLDSALNGFTLTDILGALVTGLVLYLVKKVGSMEKALAALAETVKFNTEEINRLRESRGGG